MRHLRYFIAVAEELHFARAAERLHMAQPPLSQQIQRLERLLGYPLFERTSRSVKLTPAGDVLLERARRTLRNVERDINDVRNVGAGDVGTLNIGYVGSAMLTMLPEIFRRFRNSYPGVHLRLYESFKSQVLEGLESGTLDAGILRDSDPADSLDLTALFSEPYVAVLPAKHRFAKKKSIAPAMLRDDPFIYYPRSAGARAFEKPLTIFEEHGFRPQIVQEASHWLSILALAGAGMGVSVAPACVEKISPPEVVCIPMRRPKVFSILELGLVRGDDRPIVRNFRITALVMQFEWKERSRGH